MAEYLIQSETLDAIAEAINQKAGTQDAMTPAEMVAAIGSINTGGEELFYSDYGRAYTKHMEIPISRPPTSSYERATELLSARMYGNSDVTGGVVTNAPTNIFNLCEKLVNASVENCTIFGHNCFQNCTSLKTAQLGRIGMPVTSITSIVFRNDTQNDLTITIYVADDATLPLTNSPFGATNATIIYRSATTGEVITV